MGQVSRLSNAFIVEPEPAHNGLVLIVDDDVDFAESLQEVLELKGYQCRTAHSITEFRAACIRFNPQVALIDNRLGTESGITVLETISTTFPDIIPIMMTGYGDADAVIAALRHHAYDYLPKPLETGDLFASLTRAFEKQRLVRGRQNSERALQASEEKFSKAFVACPGPMVIVSLDYGLIIETNEAFEQFLHASSSELQSKSLLEVGLWYIVYEGKQFLETLRNEGSVRGYEINLRSPEFGKRICIVSAEIVSIRNQPCGVLVIDDRTEERNVSLALEDSEQRFRRLYHDTPAIFFTLDPLGRIKSVNAYGARMLGYDRASVVGSDIYRYVVSDNIKVQRNFITRCFRNQGSTETAEVCIAKNGTAPLWLRETGHVTQGMDGMPELLLVCEDITTARKLSERLSFQATHDPLTGLVNRMEFERRLARVLNSSKKNSSAHALCYLDLDQFKVINDTCGHIAGDELLRQLCTLLKDNVRKRDTLARLGGDEFALLLEECDIDRAQRVTRQIHDAMKRFRFSWENQSFSVGVSIGMVPVDQSFADVQEILKAADTACYAAKDKGTNREHLYRPDDADLTRRHGEMQWVSKINDALDNDRFELFYQLVRPLRPNNQLQRMEILLRLDSGDGTLINPSDFFPAAERYELAPKIDEWVVQNTFQWLQQIDGLPGHIDLVCINISGRSLGDDHFTHFIERLFEESRIPAKWICFEITETAAIKNLVNATAFIESLKSRGCCFALDDFGAGMSSFAYLKNLDVDAIKIDGQFVSGIESDPIKLAVVRSINEIGKVMGKATIAEFVETEAAFRIVRDLGVDYGQGFYIAHPEPLADLKI